MYDIPWSRTAVIKNSITPIEVKNINNKFSDRKEDSVINIVYHTTPHRGLKLLVPVFEKSREG